MQMLAQQRVNMLFIKKSEVVYREVELKAYFTKSLFQVGCWIMTPSPFISMAHTASICGSGGLFDGDCEERL